LPQLSGSQARISQLEARLELLEARLRQNSRNSSLPPSTDHSRGAFERLLPPEPSRSRTVTSDRHRAYTYLSQRSWQICWAHLLRDFQAVAEQEATRPLGEALLQSGRDLFDLWHAFRRYEIAREQLQARMRPMQARVRRLLRRARDSDHWRAAPLGRDLLRYWPSLWSFLRVAEVEPTSRSWHEFDAIDLDYGTSATRSLNKSFMIPNVWFFVRITTTNSRRVAVSLKWSVLCTHPL
jgi:hypothetical protein